MEELRRKAEQAIARSATAQAHRSRVPAGTGHGIKCPQPENPVQVLAYNLDTLSRLLAERGGVSETYIRSKSHTEYFRCYFDHLVRRPS